MRLFLSALLAASPARALLMHSHAARHAVAAPPRHGCVSCSDWWPPPAGVVVTALSGCAILLRPDSALWGLIGPDDVGPAARDAASARLRSLCRADGWQLRCELQPPIERGIATKLLYGEVPPTRDVPPVLTIDLALEPRGFEGQGSVRLLRSSRFIEARGSWTAGPTSDTVDAPWAVQLQLKSACQLEIGEEMVPAGTGLFFNAQLKADAAAARVAALSGEAAEDELRLQGGTIKVLQESQLALALGVAEFQAVGSFSAQPARPSLAPSPQS